MHWRHVPHPARPSPSQHGVPLQFLATELLVAAMATVGGNSGGVAFVCIRREGGRGCQSDEYNGMGKQSVGRGGVGIALRGGGENDEPASEDDAVPTLVWKRDEPLWRLQPPYSLLFAASP